MHRVVTRRAWAHPAVVRRQRARRSVGASNRPLVWLPLDGRRDEAVGDRRISRVDAGAGAGEQAVLEIGHDPRAAAGSSAPDVVDAKVDGLHVAAARIVSARFGVAIVEAAATVVVAPVEDRIHALRRVACSDAAGGIVAVASAGRDEDAVRLLTVQRDRCANRAGQVVVAIGIWAVEAAGRSLGEVITVAGLVVNDGDEASRTGAEGVLGGGIGDTTGGQW